MDNFLHSRLVPAVLISGLVMAALPLESRAESTAVTVYSSAKPGAVDPATYKPGPGGEQNRSKPPGYAIVRQTRELDLPAGAGTVRFTDVAAEIDPTTVIIKPRDEKAGFHVLAQSFQFDLVSRDKLMERYIDSDITLDVAHGNSTESFSGTLLSSSGGSAVLRDKSGGIKVIREYSVAKFPSLPGGLNTRPTLVWDIQTAHAGKQKVEVSYETAGMTWWADYNILFEDGKDSGGKVTIAPWVSMLNRSGASYPGAKLKLIAGEVHRAPKAHFEQERYSAMPMQMAPSPVARMAEKEFFEYHMYTLGRPIDIPDNSATQIELFPSVGGIPCKKELVFFPTRTGYSFDAGTGAVPGKVETFIKFRNGEKDGLGVPLPAGRIRMSLRDADDGSVEFIGEDVIRHTPRDEEVIVKIGDAFDVVGERTVKSYSVDTDRSFAVEKVELRVRNRKKAPTEIHIAERMYRWLNWTLSDVSAKYDKKSADRIEFEPVTIQPGGEYVVNYTVKYTW